MTVGFALSGGGNLGPMQAGAIVALLENGIEADLLVGTSVGALNAAFLSTRPGLEGACLLRSAWLGLSRRDVMAFNPVTVLAGFVGASEHLFASTRLRAMMRRWVEVENIEDAPVPFAALATDAVTGEPVLLQSGDVVDALSASAAIPGLLPPVHIGGRWLVDGSLAAGCPVLQAQSLGATEVYMITTATAPRSGLPRGAIAIAKNSVSLVTTRANQEQLAAARRHAASTGGHVFVVPSGEPPAPGPYDLSKSAALAATAYEATTTWLKSEHVLPVPAASAAAKTSRTGAV
jgi:NTE family protein